MDSQLPRMWYQIKVKELLKLEFFVTFCGSPRGVHTSTRNTKARGTHNLWTSGCLSVD